MARKHLLVRSEAREKILHGCLALADAVAGNRMSRGKLVLLTAFGSGFTWGSSLLKWPDIALVNEGAL